MERIIKSSKFSLNIFTSKGLLIPSTMIVVANLSSIIFLIFSIVSLATIYFPCSFLRLVAVSFELSPLFLASSRIMSPILTTAAPFLAAISETKLFPDPGSPDIPITSILYSSFYLFLNSFSASLRFFLLSKSFIIFIKSCLS